MKKKVEIFLIFLGVVLLIWFYVSSESYDDQILAALKSLEEKLTVQTALNPIEVPLKAGSLARLFQFPLMITTVEKVFPEEYVFEEKKDFTSKIMGGLARIKKVEVDLNMENTTIDFPDAMVEVIASALVTMKNTSEFFEHHEVGLEYQNVNGEWVIKEVHQKTDLRN